MFRLTCAARRNDRDRYRFRDCARQFDVIASACAVTIHARQENFASTQAFDLLRPRDSIQPGWDAPAVDVNFPAPINPLGIDGDDDTLATELLRAFGHKFGIAHSATV